jgi:hypothetical protein
MYIDGKLVLTVDGKVGVQDEGQASVSIDQQGGAIKHFRIEFLELCLGNGLELTWEGPNIPQYTYLSFFADNND